MSAFDSQQQATIDELIEGVNASRDADDARALALYAQQLDSFVRGALALRDERANSESRYIVLQSYGLKKTNVIKALRSATKGRSQNSVLGLREAKTIAESAPILLASVNIPHTDGLLDRLRAAGAEVQLVASGYGYRYAHEVYQYFEGKSL